MRLTPEQYRAHQERIGREMAAMDVGIPAAGENSRLLATSPKPKRHNDGKATHNLLLAQIKLAKLPEPVCEYKFHPTRRWRFDLCWADKKLAVEIDGGNRMATMHKGNPVAIGRHTKDADLEKLNEAAALSYRVLRFSPAMVRSGAAIAVISRCFV